MRRIERPSRILISGSSGLLGTALRETLTIVGHEPVPLARSQRKPEDASRPTWNPALGEIEVDSLQGLDAVVHLAGENVAGRWTAEKKRRIRASRVGGTRLLAEALAGLTRPPSVLVCASAIGIYGDRGDDVLDEKAAVGRGFLAHVGREWEEASAPAEEAGIRVVRLRIGVVLSLAGGALPKMLLPFRLGLGGKLGSGRQYMSWITLDDVVGAIIHSIATPELSGAVNAVAPVPARNAAFTRALGRVLHRPVVATLPAAAVKLVFGQMGNELLLYSTRVVPRRLEESGFTFSDSQLEPALGRLLGVDTRRLPGAPAAKELPGGGHPGQACDQDSFGPT